MEALLVTLGAIMVVIAMADVFLAVLYARIGVGFLTPVLYRFSWSTLKVIAPSSRKWKDFVLSFAGPMMMAQTVIVWIMLLLIGFALICWPAMGIQIQASSGATPTDFWAAFYYSGYALTTLGTGDLIPVSSLFRVLMVLEAWLGFSVLTLALTYFMSVYTALVRRNTLAQMLHHLTGGTGKATVLVAGLASGGPGDARSQLMQIGSRVLDLLESHHSYPVLHYFRMKDPRYAMGRTAYLTLQSATLIRTALGPEFATLKQSAAVRLLWGSGIDLLDQTAASFLKKERREGGAPASFDERHSFEVAKAELSAQGIQTADNPDAPDAYRHARAQWLARVEEFGRAMDYNLSEIVPDAARPSRAER